MRAILWITIFFCWHTHLAWGNSDNVQFQQLLPRDGLSQGTVQAIVQDEFGFIWLGTADGLNRFDGYGFKNYYYSPTDPNTLSSNDITALAVTSDHKLWVGTQNGLNVYDPYSDTFIRINEDHGVPAIAVTALLAGPDGNIWIGTENGLFSLSTDLKVSDRYSNRQYVPNPNITSLEWEYPSTLWIGTKGGLSRMTLNSSGLRKFEIAVHQEWMKGPINTINSPRPHQLYVGTDEGLWDISSPRTSESWNKPPFWEGRVNSLGYDDEQDQLWVGTEDQLLRYCFSNNEGASLYTSSNLGRNSLSDNQIISIFQSKDGIWWFGASSGLNLYDPVAIKFGNYSLTEENWTDLVNNRVWSILAEGDDAWIGSEGGLVWVGPDQVIQRFEAQLGTPGTLQDNRIRSLSHDFQGNLWVGSEYGLHQYKKENESFTHHLFNQVSPDKTGVGNQILSMHWETPRKLWCGTDNGIYIFDPLTGAFANIPAQPNVVGKLQSASITFIHGDKSGNIWVGTRNGLHRRTVNDETFEYYEHDPADPNSLSHNILKAFYEDDQGRIWIGTKGGLDLLLPNGDFQHLSEADGLPNHVIYGILGDRNGRLWISTNRGLSSYTPSINIFRNFDVADGLQGQEFNTGAAAMAEDGKFYFGGINGYNAFYPDSLALNYYTPKPQIVEFELFGKPLLIGSRELPQAPWVTDTLHLTYKQDFLTLHFTALNYTQSNKNQYQYRIVNFNNDEWIDIGTDRSATITNLSGGTYIFEVNAFNNDNIATTDPTQLVIIVEPPFWDTVWFKVLAGVVVLFVAVAIFQQRVQIIQRQKENLEKMVIERTAQIQEQASSLATQAERIQRNFEESKMLAEIGRGITSNIDGMDLVRFLHQRLSDIMEIDVLVVGLFNQERQRLEVMGIKRTLDNVEKPISFQSYSIKDKHLPGVHCLNNGVPLHYNNYPEDYKREIGKGEVPSFAKYMPLSVIYVPFHQNGKVTGVIGLQSRNPNAYSEFEFNLVLNLAAYVAIASDNSRAYFTIREQKMRIEQMNESLERKVRDRTRQLEIQKNKLEEFAQINAHKVRRPLAAMMGLVPLLRWAKQDEQDNLLESLEVSSKELDGMVHRMNSILTEQGILSPEDIAKDNQPFDA